MIHNKGEKEKRKEKKTRQEGQRCFASTLTEV